MKSLPPPAQWAVLALLSAVLTAGLHWAALPASSLLAPMVAGIVLGIRGTTLRLPRVAFVGAQAVVGCLVAHAITAATLVAVAQNWFSMLAVVMSTVLASGLVGWLMVRFGSLPGTTAAWGSSPGGAAAMVAMAAEFGADARLVAFMQYFRVVLVVLSASLVSRFLLGGHLVAPAAPAVLAVPLGEQLSAYAVTLLVAVGGAWLAGRLRVPAGAMLLPMIGGAVLHGSGLAELSMPAGLQDIAYCAIGWTVGLRFTPEVIRHAVRAVPQMLVSTLALIGLCAASAWGLMRLLGMDGLTAFLATSPGGLESIAAIAVGSDADVSFVLALQTLRLAVVILTGPPVARLIARFA
ncbi:AbrB family transcriptional regulator [Oleisolibacter albus]|uniref:AbrB family transcriptional regulator n=1 Tax=Oleisolibacter albus TaxID=2171757 RepID=UPI000DF2D825|nr:AbrB family transcriptional regulator [Oleisolibacter albus]